MDCREVRRRIQHFDISREREPARRWLPLAEKTHFQLHPLVVPQDSQTKQEPAGRMRTPQVEQKGASTAERPSPAGPAGWPLADSPSVTAAELASADVAAPVDAGAGCDAVDGPVPFTSS